MRDQTTNPFASSGPFTHAVARALYASQQAAHDDLLFLERWEMAPLPGSAAALRVGQIRRANPMLAAEIRAEMKRGRPLTDAERRALAAS